MTSIGVNLSVLAKVTTVLSCTLLTNPVTVMSVRNFCMDATSKATLVMVTGTKWWVWLLGYSCHGNWDKVVGVAWATLVMVTGTKWWVWATLVMVTGAKWWVWLSGLLLS